jgi:hypothetical protein
VVHIYDGVTTSLTPSFITDNFAACPPELGKGENTLAGKLDAALDYPTGSYTIVLDGTEEDLAVFAPKPLNVTDDKKIAITIRGGGQTVQVNATGTPLFTLEAGLTLAIQDLTLKGMTSNSVPVVRVNSGGTLEMKTGSLITGNVSSSEGGGVYVNGGTFTMSGGAVNGNSATYNGGGVYINSGTFSMSGGTVNGNSTTYNGGTYGGGGVYINSGTFSMSGGAVNGNSATYDGGGVNVKGGTFMMSGGVVSGNSARFGGGVYIHGTLNMSNGTISGNSALTEGGGVYIRGTLNMSGGVIYGSDTEAGKANTAGSGAASFIYGGKVKPDGLVTGAVTNTTIKLTP